MHNMEELKDRKLLTRDEAAFYIGICKASLNKIIHGRDFPALVRIGSGRGRVFINREKLDQWIDENTGR